MKGHQHAHEPTPTRDDGTTASGISPGKRTLTGTIWRKATAQVKEGEAPEALFTRATATGGSDVPFRAEMEKSFGEDFGSVRAFFGRGDELAGLGAEAATQGGSIAFAGSAPGRELVAHELAHVVQERRHGGGAVQHKDAVSSPSHAAEREADDVAAAVVRGERVTVGAAPRAAVSLKGPCYTVAQPVGGMAELGLTAHAPVQVLEDISAEELARRAHAGEPVNVKFTPRGGKLQFKTIPAAFLDPKTFTPCEKENPHDVGGHAQSHFPRAKAIAVDNGYLVIALELRTRNRYDRAMWDIDLEGAGPGDTHRITPDRRWWNNPAWDPKAMNEASYGAYAFREGFAGFGADGKGEAKVERPLVARVPMAEIEEFFRHRGGFKETSKIVMGLKVQYDANYCPVTADEGEFIQAFGFPGQYHGEGIYRDRADGYVDLAGVRGMVEMGKGDWAEDHEVWQQPLPDNPQPNKLKNFPAHYLETNPKMAPLAPKGSFDPDGKAPSTLAMATRIENEATLALSSLGKLDDLVHILRSLCGDAGTLTSIMHAGGHPLDQFKWSIEPDKNSMVFTDIYFDDPGLHALTAGVGIRRRSSPKATKLNVKTGEGYNVGKIDDTMTGYTERRTPRPDDKSDIYRRHEISFDLDPDASPQQIGEFLAQGVGPDGKADDPWNKGGEQANLVSQARVGAPISFRDLAPQMVLEGQRQKFKLTAVGRDGGMIAIEISCDHTVGRTFSDWREKPDGNPFDDIKGAYHHRYNVEMELDHLGANVKADAHTPQPSSSKLESPVMQPSSSNAHQEPQPMMKMPREGHPGRMYMLADTSSPQFNTRSYQVFARAQEHFVRWAREQPAIGKGELGKDRQKLETLFEALKLQPQVQPQTSTAPEKAPVHVNEWALGRPWEQAVGPRSEIGAKIPGCRHEKVGNLRVITVGDAKRAAVAPKYLASNPHRQVADGIEIWFSGASTAGPLWESLKQK